MYYAYPISDETVKLAQMAEEDCREVFRRIDNNAMHVSSSVLKAFNDN